MNQADTDRRDAPPDAPAASGPPPTSDAPPTSSDGAGRRIAPWIVAVVTTAVAVVAVVQWLRLDSAAAADRAVQEVAQEVVVALTNWQADQLDEVRTVIERRATDRFGEEASALLDDFAAGLQEADARSTGEILDLVADAHVVPVTVDGEVREELVGVALAVVRQETENAALQRPDVQCWGVRMTIEQVNGRWLADGVELYGPNTCPEAGAVDGAGEETP